MAAEKVVVRIAVAKKYSEVESQAEDPIAAEEADTFADWQTGEVLMGAAC